MTGTGLGLGASSAATGSWMDSWTAGGGAGVLVTSAGAAGLAVDGAWDGFWMPMLVEATCVIVLLIASRVLPHPQT